VQHSDASFSIFFSLNIIRTSEAKLCYYVICRGRDSWENGHMSYQSLSWKSLWLVTTAIGSPLSFLSLSKKSNY
jgi:hypothetical protein